MRSLISATAIKNLKSDELEIKVFDAFDTWSMYKFVPFRLFRHDKLHGIIYLYHSLYYITHKLTILTRVPVHILLKNFTVNPKLHGIPSVLF